jgi:hypothetical protein
LLLLALGIKRLAVPQADQVGKAATDCMFMHRGGDVHPLQLPDNLPVQLICTVEVKHRVLLTSACKL